MIYFIEHSDKFNKENGNVGIVAVGLLFVIKLQVVVFFFCSSMLTEPRRPCMMCGAV